MILARGFAVDVARSSGWNDDFALGLLVSELATNSIQAKASLFTVTVFEPYEDQSGRYLMFEVADDCPTVPAPKQRMPEVVEGQVPSENGRGLPLVDALSESWHAEKREHGKTICVTLKEEHQAAARSRTLSIRPTPSVA
ncbi:hypothetical protein GCM10010442_57030 [Kitasatospora kifunensis]|uniref:Anti-sigma regulatory factor (Ser/Thr protein kinase) n=1 Tax=Kitasatospora kifunensis TaxID=58351 RepID=A0A7W7VV82_KITKI|nr:anti-sigma regulatory factor (Ser/Thr protein kinase) [Kitasatospora kifunensis]